MPNKAMSPSVVYRVMANKKNEGYSKILANYRSFIPDKRTQERIRTLIETHLIAGYAFKKRGKSQLQGIIDSNLTRPAKPSKQAIKKAIGKRLKSLRLSMAVKFNSENQLEEKGRGLEEISSMTGISVPRLIQLEEGEAEKFQFAERQKLSGVYGLNLYKIYNDDFSVNESDKASELRLTEHPYFVMSKEDKLTQRIEENPTAKYAFFCQLILRAIEGNQRYAYCRCGNLFRVTSQGSKRKRCSLKCTTRYGVSDWRHRKKKAASSRK